MFVVESYLVGFACKKSLILFCNYLSRLQKVKIRKLQLAGTGERLMISNSYNRHNARSPVPARKNLLFAGDSYLKKIEYLLAPKVE